MSLKNTKRAEIISPTPVFKTIRQPIGNKSKRKLHCKGMPSAITKIKKTTNVSKKLISVETFLDNKNKYLGTLILVKIPALLTSEFMLPVVASL